MWKNHFVYHKVDFKEKELTEACKKKQTCRECEKSPGCSWCSCSESEMQSRCNSVSETEKICPFDDIQPRDDNQIVIQGDTSDEFSLWPQKVAIAMGVGHSPWLELQRNVHHSQLS